MTNLDFFKAYFNNEFKATYVIINAIPVDKMHYKPHPINRSAYELAEHIVAHVYDFNLRWRYLETREVEVIDLLLREE